MRLLTWTLSAVAALALAVSPAAASPVFTLDPLNGALAGPPGQVLGWGLTIQNDNSGWLVVDSVTYNQSQSIGDFVDFVSPQFLTSWVVPNGVWDEAFDPSISAGLGSYVIADFASPGDQAIGDLVLTYDIHSIEPGSQGDDTVNEYSVSLLAPSLPATVTDTLTPEPAAIATTLIGLALLGLGKARRRA
ncbi:conserved exported hypothetical protein [Candidatus Sulfopaludibacter sp. SbA3]|nr:conserved exported hypothetical protein [Candidatus Sulfopaludibacter sp. SbA3]